MSIRSRIVESFGRRCWAGLLLPVLACGLLSGERRHGRCYVEGPDGIELRYVGGYPTASEHRLPLEGADPATFRVLYQAASEGCQGAELYAADARQLYYRDSPMPGASAEGFRALGRGYAVDARGAWYQAEPLPGVRPAALQVLDAPTAQAFAQDGRSLFRRAEAVPEVLDPASFELLDSGFARDGAAVYDRMLRSISGALPDSFEILPVPGRSVTAHTWARDARRVYFQDRGRLAVLGGASPAAFEVLNKSYGRDATHLFFEGAEVEGADPATFSTSTGANAHVGADRHGRIVSGLRAAP